LFKEKLYNGDESIHGFTQDYYANVFGGARLRQMRIQPGELLKLRFFVSVLNKVS